MRSTFTPASASALKKVAETPGLERMPAPISESLPISGSETMSWKPIRSWAARRAAMASLPSTIGRVKEMSVRPEPSREMFCTIMSMFTLDTAITRKISAALPGTSGTPTIVTLPSERSWATPETMGCSMGAPS